MVAQKLRCDFVDLDDAVLKRLGTKNVTDTFRDIGEAAWRSTECAELKHLLSYNANCVLSLGGGTPTAPGATEILLREQAQKKLVIALLDPGEMELAKRLAKNRGDRPPLPGTPSTGDSQADAVAEVRLLMQVRMPLYRSLADTIVDTSASEQVCAELIIAAFQKSV